MRLAGSSCEARWLRPQVAGLLLAAVVAGAPLLLSPAGHPLVRGWRQLVVPAAPVATPRELFFDRADELLEPEVELLIWFADADRWQLSELAHEWVATAYRLAPRRVYPLLTPPLLDRLRRSGRALAGAKQRYLESRAASLRASGATASLAVAVWGGAEPCRIDSLPELTVVHSRGRGCLLRPRRAGGGGA